MPSEIEKLERRMRAAAEATDFELARQLRDQINLIRGGASAEDAVIADTAGLTDETAERFNGTGY